MSRIKRITDDIEVPAEPPEEAETCYEICKRMGRSESWVRARIIKEYRARGVLRDGLRQAKDSSGRWQMIPVYWLEFPEEPKTKKPRSKKK